MESSTARGIFQSPDLLTGQVWWETKLSPQKQKFAVNPILIDP